MSGADYAEISVELLPSLRGVIVPVSNGVRSLQSLVCSLRREDLHDTVVVLILSDGKRYISEHVPRCHKQRVDAATIEAKVELG